MTPISTLLYGGPGSGKTGTALSSFWDFTRREFVEGRRGRWIRIGKEQNPMISPPDEFVKRIEMGSDASTIARRAITYITELTQAIKTGAFEKQFGYALTDIVFDGITELGAIRTATEDGDGDKWVTYRGWKADYINLIQLLDPEELNCNIFLTARIGEAKKGTMVKQVLQGKDPEWLEAMGLIPEIDGWARKHLSNHHQYVFFMEQGVTKKPTGKVGEVLRIPHVELHMIPDGDYWVKNQAAHAWAGIKGPATLTNPKWSEVEALLDKASQYVVK